MNEEKQAYLDLLKQEMSRRSRISLVESVRLDFYQYCKFRLPAIYRDDRPHLKELCDEFQSFAVSTDRYLIVNLPPRHCKSLTASLFVEWLIGNDNQTQIMTGSYNESVAKDFSKGVRDTISADHLAQDLSYKDIFDGTELKYGSQQAKQWSVKGQSLLTYLATSPNGSATGKGTDWLIIDDVIKGVSDAMNQSELDKQWRWFTDTMLSRVEQGGKVVVIMTRWSTNDLAGKLISMLEQMDKQTGVKEYRLISKKALVDESSKEMLCPTILSYKDYMSKAFMMGKEILSANYQQEPIDVKGALYSQPFEEYTDMPDIPPGVYARAYIDTADKGSDYLCSIVWVPIDGKNYVTSIIYTQEPMEVTELLVADQLNAAADDYGRVDVTIESNNGGRGFGRVIDDNTVDNVVVDMFHQTANKESRIITNAPSVNKTVIMPYSWDIEQREFSIHVLTYQRSGKNAHDDAQDTLTGIVETMMKDNDLIAEEISTDDVLAWIEQFK